MRIGILACLLLMLGFSAALISMRKSNNTTEPGGNAAAGEERQYPAQAVDAERFQPGSSAAEPQASRLVVIAVLGHSQALTENLRDDQAEYVYNQTVPGAFQLDSGAHGPAAAFPPANLNVGLLRIAGTYNGSAWTHLNARTGEPHGGLRLAPVGLSLGHVLKRLVGDQADILVVQAGAGGQYLAQLSKGGSTGQYESLMQQVDRAIQWGTAHYPTVEVHHALLHGHMYEDTEGGATGGLSYEQQWAEHVSDITADLKAKTGQSDVYVFHDQSENPQEYRTGNWFRTQPDAILVGPRYGLADWDDEIHLDPKGTFNLGALYAKAIAESPVFGGTDRDQGVRIASARRNGSRITLTFSGFEGALDMAPGTGGNSQGGYYGLRFLRDGVEFNPATVRREGDALVIEDASRITSGHTYAVRGGRRPSGQNAPRSADGSPLMNDNGWWGYIRDSRDLDGWVYETGYPGFDGRQYLVNEEVAVTEGGTGTGTIEPAAEPVFELGEGSPNPFRSEARFKLHLSSQQYVVVEALDAAGRRVRRLHQGTLAAGDHPVTLSGAGLPSGTYYVSARSRDHAETRTAIRVE